MSAVRTLATLTGLEKDSQVTVRDLCLDSRRIATGDVFFSLAGDHAVASNNMQQAIHQGAVAIVVDLSQPEAECLGVPLVRVPNMRQTLGAIADHFYNAPSARTAVIGITGTNGKTSCCHWIAQGWSRLAAPAGMIGTLGSGLFIDGAANHGVRQETGLTTPDVLSNHRLLDDLCRHRATAVAMEVSSHALDQGRVDGIRFDTAVFTNLSRDHLDYHGDMDAYGKAKRVLFARPELQWAIINSDDVFGAGLKKYIHHENSHANVLTYALHDSMADIGVERCEVTGHAVVAGIRTPWGRGALQSKYPGGFNLLNVLAVVGTLCSHGMDLQSVLEVVGQLQAVPGRTQIVSADADDVLVVVDYAHTPDALEKVLAAVRERCQQQLWCVFGCGGNRDQGKRPQMGAIASTAADRIVITSDNPRDENPLAIIDAVVAGCSTDNVVIEADRQRAIFHAVTHAVTGDAIVIAGKGHEEYQEVAGQRYPFSDVVVAVTALRQRRAAVGLAS